MTLVFLFSKTDIVDFPEVITKGGSTPEIRRTKVRTPRTDVGLLALLVMEVWKFLGLSE